VFVVSLWSTYRIWSGCFQISKTGQMAHFWGADFSPLYIAEMKKGAAGAEVTDPVAFRCPPQAAFNFSAC